MIQFLGLLFISALPLFSSLLCLGLLQLERNNNTKDMIPKRLGIK